MLAFTVRPSTQRFLFGLGHSVRGGLLLLSSLVIMEADILVSELLFSIFEPPYPHTHLFSTIK